MSPIVGPLVKDDFFKADFAEKSSNLAFRVIVSSTRRYRPLLAGRQSLQRRRCKLNLFFQSPRGLAQEDERPFFSLGDIAPSLNCFIVVAATAATRLDPVSAHIPFKRTKVQLCSVATRLYSTVPCPNIAANVSSMAVCIPVTFGSVNRSVTVSGSKASSSLIRLCRSTMSCRFCSTVWTGRSGRGGIVRGAIRIISNNVIKDIITYSNAGEWRRNYR
jgi:hypothetical protein